MGSLLANRERNVKRNYSLLAKACRTLTGRLCAHDRSDGLAEGLTPWLALALCFWLVQVLAMT